MRVRSTGVAEVGDDRDGRAELDLSPVSATASEYAFPENVVELPASVPDGSAS